MAIRTTNWREGGKNRIVERFLERPAFDMAAEAVAGRILADIRKNGDRAVLRYARQFDVARFPADGMKVMRREIAEARRNVDAWFRKAMSRALKRVSTFARAGLRRDWSMGTACGGRVGEKFVPLDRVGVYVPGGTAPLVSTAIMTAALAHVAGVPEIAACTPCGRDGRINPYMLMALKLAGATEIYRVGGIQAIGMMAYGTRSVRKVQKIVGPGNRFVTAAKRLVYGHVALDLVAGPSELAVLADDSADPACVAADLLSQAEHGTGWEKLMLVTMSSGLAGRVRKELVRQTASLVRAKTVRTVLKRGTLIVIVRNIADGIALCNRFGPEHLELMVRNPRSVLDRIRCAGAVFLGPWSPEPVGDFVAGPSHVLPTGGTAAMFSGLTADDFRRRSSVIEYTKRDLKEALPVIEAFGRVEGLDAHARSARIRF